MIKVIILRGIPGCGKSYFTKQYKDAKVVSADHYMVNLDGKYEFKIEKLSDCHKECLRSFLDHIEGLLGFDLNRRDYNLSELDHTIIVDNTNISAVEIAPYYAVASALDCDVEIITLNIEQEIAFVRQKHGVGEGHHKRMASNLVYQQKQFPSYWNHKILTWNKEGDCYEK